MPRKRSDFNPGIYAFKGFASIDRSLGNPRGSGFYPSNREFGSTVQRSVIDQWNLESDWVKWRKGYEIYNRTAWSTLKIKNENYDPGLEETNSNTPFVDALLNATLYKNTPYEISNTFSGYEYPTMKADTNTHYVVKRTPENISLGTVTSVKNDSFTYTDNFNNGEIFVSVNPDATTGKLLRQMVGERITDGAYTDDNRTEATLKRILTSDTKPAIYTGRTLSDELKNFVELKQKATTVKISIPVADVNVTTNNGDFIPNQGVNNQVKNAEGSLDILANPELLTNKIIYVTNFFIDKPLSSMNSVTFKDDDFFFEVSINESETGQALVGLDQGVNELPPSMLDLTDLPTIFTTTNASYTIEGSYVFKKASYQKYFGSQYLTGEVVQGLVQDIAYSIIPFIVEKADIVNNQFIIESRPYFAEVKLYPALEAGTQLVFSDNSFAKTFTTNEKWTNLHTDVDPWMDEVFTTELSLRPSITYSCSCPNYSHTLLAMPQSTQDSNTRKTNRQQRYPLPTALSPDEFDMIGQNKVAGKAASWETDQHRLSFKLCKHVIASMFNDDVRVREPNQYPIGSDNRYSNAAERFNEKLVQEIINSANAYNLSYKRTGISISEIVFAMSNGLNLDSIETAYVVLDSTQ